MKVVSMSIWKVVAIAIVCVILGSVLQQVSTRDKAPPPAVIANADDPPNFFKATLKTKADTIYLMDGKDGHGKQVGEFVLPSEGTVTIEFRRAK